MSTRTVLPAAELSGALHLAGEHHYEVSYRECKQCKVLFLHCGPDEEQCCLGARRKPTDLRVYVYEDVLVTDLDDLESVLLSVVADAGHGSEVGRTFSRTDLESITDIATTAGFLARTTSCAHGEVYVSVESDRVCRDDHESGLYVGISWPLDGWDSLRLWVRERDTASSDSW